LNYYTSVPNPQKGTVGIFTPGSAASLTITDNNYAPNTNISVNRYNNYGTHEFDTALPSNYNDTLWHSRWFTVNGTLLGQYFAGNPQVPSYDDDGNMTWDGSVLSDGTTKDTGVSLAYEYDTENHLTCVYNRDYKVKFI
jgi:hypothetical protein